MCGVRSVRVGVDASTGICAMHLIRSLAFALCLGLCFTIGSSNPPGRK